MIILCSGISDLEYLFKKFKLPFWVEEGIRLIQQREAVPVFEKLDDRVDVHGLKLAVAEVGNVGVKAASEGERDRDIRQCTGVMNLVQMSRSDSSLSSITSV